MGNDFVKHNKNTKTLFQKDIIKEKVIQISFIGSVVISRWLQAKKFVCNLIFKKVI